MNLYYSDFIIPQQKWHSTSASLQMDLIVDLHHYVMFYLILIMVVVLITLGNALVLSKPPYAFGRQIREFLVEEWFDKYDMDMILYTSYDLQCLRFMYRSAFPSRENVVESLERWFKFEPLGLFLPWNWFFGQAELIYNFEQDYDHIIIFLNLEIPLDWPIFYRIDDIPTIYDPVLYPEYNAHTIKDLLIVQNYHLRWIIGSVILQTTYWEHRFTPLFRYKQYRPIIHARQLEYFWIILPSLILLAIALPSMFVLYLLDEAPGYILVYFKVIGHQWYWSYEIADTSFNTFKKSAMKLPVNFANFESYMIPVTDLPLDGLRLLEVDQALRVPVGVPLAFIVTSDDVIHSWAVPSLGIKIDAIPGRLNQVFCLVRRAGEFYGQCSELCGIHHGFMPIKIIAERW